MDVTLINALIALLEDRPESAREMLRSPAMGQKLVPGLQARLYRAIETCENRSTVQVLRQVLSQSARITPEAGIDEDAFYRGVQAIEDQIVARLKTYLPE